MDNGTAAEANQMQGSQRPKRGATQAVNYRENLIRAYRRQKPQWVPIASGYPPMMWAEYDPGELENLMLTHPILFPGYKKGDVDPNNPYVPPDMIRGRPYTDAWGCVWETNYTGMVGAVRHHPLADWAAFEGYRAPDPEKTDGMRPVDWAALRESREQARRDDAIFGLGLPHGHTFLRIQDLRGYENFMCDMMDEEPRISELIAMVEAFNLELIRRFVALAPDIILIPEDLGMQTMPMISPALFRKFIKPSYLRITRPVKEAGIIVHEHSDGHILDLIDDLVDCGGDVINLQDLVNGLDNIQSRVKGRMAIDLDIDRQSVTVTGSPKDIDDHIREAVTKLGAPEGGLSLCYQPWPPTPIANIRAVFDAMEKYCTMWS